MGELILVKTERTHISGSLNGEYVVGIRLPGLATTIDHEYEVNGREVEEAVVLPDGVERNIRYFYEQCRAASPENAPTYNCYLFAWHALGRVVDLRRHDTYRYKSPALSVETNALRAGEAYCIRTAEDVANHALIGINRPDHNLSILGDQSPLAVTRNTDLLDFYDGIEILHVSPDYGELG